MKLKLDPKDKRSKLDLELFVIALIDRETNTPYLLQTKGCLSPGATIPVLKKLEKLRLIRRGKSGARGRADYEVTALGKQHLNSQWKSLLQGQTPSDVEAILRIASLGLLCGATRNAVATYLLQAADTKDAIRKSAKNERKRPVETDEAGMYAWMRFEHVKARQKAEVDILRKLASTLVD